MESPVTPRIDIRPAPAAGGSRFACLVDVETPETRRQSNDARDGPSSFLADKAGGRPPSAAASLHTASRQALTQMH